MASSKDRRPSPKQPSDRRMGAGRQPPPDRRMQPPKDPGAKRKQRLIILIGMVILGVIAGIAIYGYYREFIAPTRVLAARVGDTRYTQGDLVKRMRLLQASSEAAGETMDFSSTPFSTLNSMAEAGIILRFAPVLGIRVTDEDVELALRRRFSPTIPEGQEVREGQVDREFREFYQAFLDISQLSDNDNRRLVKEQIARARLRELLGEQVPTLADQVEVNWIVLRAPADIIGSGPPALPPDQVLELLEEEDFEDVARKVSMDRIFSDNKGYVGWVPEGAFPFLDETLFGSDERAPIAHNEVSEPIFSEDGTYLIKVTSGPDQREISDEMRDKLKDRALENWLLEKKESGTAEGWWEIKFDSKIYAWVVDQVTAASRSTAGQGNPR